MARGRPKGCISNRKGVKLSPETCARIGASKRGRVCSPEDRRKKSEALKGPKSHLWRGGITPINKQLRHSLEMKLARESCFERDDYTCQECGARGVELHPHHIKPFAQFPELRFEVSNLKTLCVPCHKETDTYAVKNRWVIPNQSVTTID